MSLQVRWSLKKNCPHQGLRLCTWQVIEIILLAWLGWGRVGLFTPLEMLQSLLTQDCLFESTKLNLVLIYINWICSFKIAWWETEMSGYRMSALGGHTTGNSCLGEFLLEVGFLTICQLGWGNKAPLLPPEGKGQTLGYYLRIWALWHVDLDRP